MTGVQTCALPIYLRIQAEIDHAQGPGYFRHAIEMVNAATGPQYGGAGSAAWTRMNGSDLGNPVNAVYPLDNPSGYPAWVSDRVSDHPGLEIAYIREMAALANGPVGGIAEAPATEASPAEMAESSGGSSSALYAAVAGAAAGAVLLGAGGWYARRRWRAG